MLFSLSTVVVVKAPEHCGPLDEAGRQAGRGEKDVFFGVKLRENTKKMKGGGGEMKKEVLLFSTERGQQQEQVY